jgi:sec-independent protein translocase protein TatB
MDFLGIGPLEVLFVLVIALIIFGPKDIVKAGQATGRWLRKLITSPGFQTVQRTSRDLRNLPNKLAREAGLEDVQQDIGQIGSMVKPPDLKKEINETMEEVGEGLSAWTTPVVAAPKDAEEPKDVEGAGELKETETDAVAYQAENPFSQEAGE